jgi:cytochrome b pre-mRNA-processing protein 3
MLRWLKQNAEIKRIGHDIYARIVAQARSAAFYQDCGVPDTMEGRFEMILLHLIVVLERLKGEGGRGQKIGQRILESLVADMDDALRQIGIGDMGVPKRVQRVAAAVVERSRAYTPDAPSAQSPTDMPQSPLELALLEHIYRAPTAGSASLEGGHARGLATYITRARAALTTTSGGDILAARFAFPAVNA